MLGIFVFDIQTGLAVALLISSTSMTIAFSNVVVDAILINQARRDQINGSQELLALASICIGLGGIGGCIAGGLIT